MRSPRRRSVLALLGVSAAAAAAVPLLTVAIGAGPLAPDLRADPPEKVTGPELYQTSGGIGAGRLLVRFDGFVTNVGQGPIEISGNPQTGDLRQRAATSWGPGSTLANTPVTQVVGQPPVYYETADGHNHFHLKNAMRYSLWNASRTAQVAAGSKVGFCLYDIQQLSSAPVMTTNPNYTEAVTNFCDQGNPGATSLKMGTSPGWRDVYNKSLSYQWVDVSDTSPGTYYVAADADPDNLLWEGGGSAETNTRSFASTPVTIPGWVAKPVTTAQTGAAKNITLQTTKFGGQGDSTLRFKVVDPPDHGSLDQATGATFASSTVRYTPQAGYSGPDSFSYVAIYNGYGYPLNPPVGTVSLTSGVSQSVAISGAPASMTAGTSAQLTAALTNLSGGVTWSTTGGSVSPTGLVTAPGTPGTITVTAASTAVPSVSSSVNIGVNPVPAQVPMPSVAVKSPTGVKLLSDLGTGHVGRRIIVGKVVVGPKSGRLRFTATINRTVLGRCSVKAPARKAVNCKIVLKRNYPLKKVKMTAQLKFGKKSIVRRSYIVR